MPCARTFFDPETGKPTGFVCGEGIVPCSVCGAAADHLCDYPMGRGKTCDAPLCRMHAIGIRPFPENRLRVTDEPDTPNEEAEWVEFCPQHFAVATASKEKR